MTEPGFEQYPLTSRVPPATLQHALADARRAFLFFGRALGGKLNPRATEIGHVDDIEPTYVRRWLAIGCNVTVDRNGTVWALYPGKRPPPDSGDIRPGGRWRWRRAP